MNTEMRKFGSGNRAGHDSTDFYNRNLYNQSESKTNLKLKAKKDSLVKASAINQIYMHSSESMAELPDNSVHLMITSPPYNVGKEYDEDLTEQEYRHLLKNVWKETFRVLV